MSYVDEVDLRLQTYKAFNTPARAEVDRVGKYQRFLPIARAFAGMSKDPSTKVGAVILGPGFEVRSSGWNGATRFCRADEDERYQDRVEKLYWAAHAEANAIANAARTGTPLEGCALVVTHMPCMSCAKTIVQAGLSLVVAPKPEAQFAERWAEDLSRSRRLFAECGVRVIEIDENGE